MEEDMSTLSALEVYHLTGNSIKLFSLTFNYIISKRKISILNKNNL